MALYCTVSREMADELVVSAKSGHVFEKRLILKALEQEEKCPVTGNPLAPADLVPVHAAKVPCPRAPGSATVPGIIATMQAEWEVLLEEAHQLRRDLDEQRQQLNQALFQQAAAQRLIARLADERDEARADLLEHRVGISEAIEAAVLPDEEPTAAPPTGLGFTDARLARMQETYDKLSAMRRKRRTPPDLKTADEINGYRDQISVTQLLHRTYVAGITCLTVHPERRNIFLTGGMDKMCVVFDSATGNNLGLCQGHTKRVKSVSWHPSATKLLAVSGSMDRTCRVWTPKKEDKKKYEMVTKYKNHGSEVVTVAVHPCGDFFASASYDGAWALYDIEAEECFKVQTNAAGGPLSCLAFHPDGFVMGTGMRNNGNVHLWDLKQRGLPVAELPCHRGAATALAFNENGYLLATGGADGIVNMWDLRTQKNLDFMNVGSHLNALAFDQSGTYLAALGKSDARVFRAKERTLVGEYPRAAKAMTGIAWGPDARWLVVSSMDRSVRVFGEHPTGQ